MALKEFFDKAKEQSWFKNTLFVITADHTNQNDHPAYKDKAGHAAAPIIFYDLRGRIKGSIEEPILSYGSNLFDKEAEHIALNFFDGQCILFTKEITVAMKSNGQVKITAPAAYLQTEPSQAVMPSEEVQKHYSRLLKAIVQDYNHSVFQSSFSIKEMTPS